MHAKKVNRNETVVIDVRAWLGNALLTGRVYIPADGIWPRAVLDGKPFPLAAAFLGFLHAAGGGPSQHPEPDAFCTMAEQLRARRLASEMNAELRGWRVDEKTG